MTVQTLTPLCYCPKCRAFAIVELTPAQRLAQPDDTTHVCHPALGGCNHGFTDDRTLEPSAESLSYGVKCQRCGRWATQCACEPLERELGGSKSLVNRDQFGNGIVNRARPNQYADYGWMIDRETVSTENDANISPENRTKSRVGWVGPRDIAPEIEQDLRNGKGKQFRMYDDDGILYYEGRYLGPDDETAFGPLTDLGTPDAGAVRIDYREGDRFVTL